MTSLEADPARKRTLIDELLDEQQRLTAVERFSRRHETGAMPAQSRYYRDLIPGTRPAPGQQYAFAVDLDACTGCKACVSACHSLNGLDEEEVWRNVGMIHGGTAEKPYQQTVTTACHHCVEPGCLEGCPVLAYEKDSSTGIVRHLDDQCIGCQYCVLKCPYDVPKYSEKKGIVRKCDMCTNRLAVGEAPACVQACPTQAIRIELVDREEISRAAKSGGSLVPGAFTSSYTKPSTRFHSHRPMPENTRAADAHALRLDHAHWPLIWMLVLTQTSVGLFTALAVILVISSAFAGAVAGPIAVAAFAALNAGLGVSVLHLGRPLGAWRFFLGLRTSWMSREILAFSMLAGAAAVCTAFANFRQIAEWLPAAKSFESLLPVAKGAVATALVTALLGWGSVYCSAMIYIDTHRPFWARELTLPKFFGTTTLLGASATASVLGWIDCLVPADLHSFVVCSALITTVIRTALFGWEFQNLINGLRNPDSPVHRACLTMWKLRRDLVCTRGALFVASTAFGLLALGWGGIASALFASISLLLTASSQIIERYFYFVASDAPRMPGGVAP